MTRTAIRLVPGRRPVRCWWRCSCHGFREVRTPGSRHKNGEWPMALPTWLAEVLPLEINAGNFSKLEVAWRFKTDNSVRVPRTSFQGHANG